MKTLKSILILVLPISILAGNILFGQEEQKLDKWPAPIGGMESILKNVVYPEKAREEKLQGKVFVNALIDEDGNVEKVSIDKSANELLDKAAMEAIKKVKFTPGELNGKKVKAEVIIPVLFKLN